MLSKCAAVEMRIYIKVYTSEKHKHSNTDIPEAGVNRGLKNRIQQKSEISGALQDIPLL